MLENIQKRWLLFILWMGVSGLCIAQYQLTNLSLQADLSSWYDDAYGREKIGYLSGEYHAVNLVTLRSNPFFLTNKWIPGSMAYRGQRYDSVFLMFDIYSDKLLLRHPTAIQFFSLPINPVHEDVAWFQLDGHHFAYVKDKIAELDPGFYDILFRGDQITLMARRIKVVKPVDGRQLAYEHVDRVFIQKQGAYHPVRRASSVFRAFPEHKKAMRQYVREHALRPRRDREWDLISLMQYCDTLR